jgi:hypothetical protein
VVYEENCPCHKFDYEWCVLHIPTSHVYAQLTLPLPVTSISSVNLTSVFLSDLNLSLPVFARMNARTRSIWGRLATDLCLVILARRMVALSWTNLSRNPVVKVRFRRC